MADQPMAFVPAVPTQDERTTAFLAHLLQVFTGFIGPLIIFCVKQDSRFVKFHALQCLLWQLCYMVCFFIGIIVFFFTIVGSIAQTAVAGNHGAFPSVLLVAVPLIWLLAAGGGIANIVLGIVYGLKANRGEWAAYPLIGTWLIAKYGPPSPYLSRS
jgi:hypothetical protein